MFSFLLHSDLEQYFSFWFGCDALRKFTGQAKGMGGGYGEQRLELRIAIYLFKMAHRIRVGRLLSQQTGLISKILDCAVPTAILKFEGQTSDRRSKF